MLLIIYKRNILLNYLKPKIPINTPCIAGRVHAFKVVLFVEYVNRVIVNVVFL